jgi:rSAM/selenodomain-associated transferase 1
MAIEGSKPMAASEISQDCILFFVKSPEQTTVKSRLAEAVGVKMAQELYRNFVLDMLDTLSDVTMEGRHDLKVCFHPPKAGPDIRAWLGDACDYEPQQGNDLGERMQNAFQSSFASGYRRVLLLGSDAPDLTSEIITEGLSRLTTHAAVIGPAGDGGYYLLGFQSQTFLPAIFSGMPWSTGEVYARTREVFRRTHTNVFVLPTWRDIDTLSDLQHLQEGNRNDSFAHSRTMRYLLKQNLLDIQNRFPYS